MLAEPVVRRRSARLKNKVVASTGGQAPGTAADLNDSDYVTKAEESDEPAEPAVRGAIPRESNIFQHFDVEKCYTADHQSALQSRSIDIRCWKMLENVVLNV